MTYNNIGAEIREKSKHYDNKKAIYSKDVGQAVWKGITWKELNKQMQNLSKALLKFGIKTHDNIGIFADNMPEWIIADVAIVSIRAVSTPIYATNSQKEATYIIDDAEIPVLFVAGQDQYDMAVEIGKTSNFLKLIVALKNDILIKDTSNSVYLQDFIGSEFDKSIDIKLNQAYSECKVSDLASIIYTSGTTGEPKGVMLSHANFLASLKAHDYELDVSDKDVSLSFLPLSHIFERSWVFFCLHNGIEVYFNRDPKQIAEVLKKVKPTIMCTVPRIYEKIYTAIQDKKKEASLNKVKMMDWALSVGNEYYNNHKRLELAIPLLLKMKFKIADKLVLRKLRDVFGGRIKFMPCGGAPLSAEMLKYFHSFGLNVKLGYGLTETTATASLFGSTQFEFNSAGKAIKGTKLKIGDDNEILIKGPGVMQGYYKKPEETAAVFKDGWFCSGDAGKIDEKGNIVITDRIKDLMKTSGGKYIAPQKLETTLINDSFIEQIAVIGDQQKYVTALAVPSFENLKKYAIENRISFKTIEDLITNNQIIAFFEEKFEDLQKEFSVFEKIKKFTLLPKEFSMEAGEITATLKLKRKLIQEKYKVLIDKMYAD